MAPHTAITRPSQRRVPSQTWPTQRPASDDELMTTLVTGVAGFIGMHVARRLLEDGADIVGIDNLNDYYDVQLKRDRLAQLDSHNSYRFAELDLADRAGMEQLFADSGFKRVVNLAAQPGVRYSIDHPHAYAESNLVGFLNVLEGCRRHHIDHLVYASSSSVYGANTSMPFSVHDNVDHPVSLYAATKKSNELMAHTYSYLFGIPTTGLRFFTVYGPWGRPDMAPSLFASAILDGQPIDVFNHGRMQRDFTYIDDIVEGVARVLDSIPAADSSFDPSDPNAAASSAPYRLYNIGNHEPVELMTFIETLETALGKRAEKKMLPMQPGDVIATYADVEALREAVGFSPETPLAQGLAEFADWFKNYYGSSG